MTEALESPRTASELYLARCTQVSLFRPMMTGDIYAGVGIPGVDDMESEDDEQLAMIVTHPCSMRQGVQIKERLQVVRVARAPLVELPAWKGNFDRIPLPELRVDIDEDLEEPPDDPAHYAGFFELRGRVPVVDLSLHRRIACMSEEGVAFLHQRMSHADTRYSPRIRELMSACSGVFAEAELEEDWKESFVDSPEKYSDTALRRILDREAAELDRILSKQRVHTQGKKTIKSTLREDLGDDQKRANARRTVTGKMRRRASCHSF